MIYGQTSTSSARSALSLSAKMKSVNIARTNANDSAASTGFSNPRHLVASCAEAVAIEL